MGTDRYNTIIQRKPDYTDFTFKTHIPNPTDVDYQRRYITRYFIQKSNDRNSPIFEVNSDTYSSAISNPYYIGVELDWSIIGNGDDVKNSNRASISIASQSIPTISLYLPNLLQFWKA
jgi:hypothetical protein